MVFSGSNPLTSAASFTFCAAGSYCVIGAMPHAPALTAAQLSGIVSPTGVTAPMPVITTRLLSKFRSSCRMPHMPMPPSTQSTCPVI